MSKDNNCLSMEAKKFILHNCYTDVLKYDKDSKKWYLYNDAEVSPFSCLSYLRYPFVKNNKFNPYYNWTPGVKGNTSDAVNKKKGFHFIDKEKCLYNEGFTKHNIHIGKSRQISTGGCFLSSCLKEEDLSEKWTDIDLSADIITSLKTIVNKINKNYKLTTEKEYALKSDLFSNKELIKKICKDNKLQTALEKFICVVGTVGNMLPIPGRCNKNYGEEWYFGKLSELSKIFYRSKYVEVKWNEIYCDSRLARIKDYNSNKLLMLRMYPWERDTEYKIYWIYFFGKFYKNKDWKDFVKDFYLNDYFDDGDNRCNILHAPYPDLGNNKKTYSIEDCWTDWLNENVRLILRRSLRIYTGKDSVDLVSEYFNNLLDWSKKVNKNKS